MLCGVILAGGLGTRLAQTVPGVAKTLAPIQGIPFLHILLLQLQKANIVSKVILALGYKAEQVVSFFEKQSYSFEIEFSIETTPLGTGGALLYALQKCNEETLLVLNGDSYFDLSLPDFLEYHRSKNADITLACKEVEDPSRYGSIEMAPSFRILHFREKSSLNHGCWINAGLYLIQRNLLNSFLPGVYSLEKDFLPTFLQKNIFAYPHDGCFIDIGTSDSYTLAQQILKKVLA